MAFSCVAAAAVALAAAPAPPPFSGPATPSAINMLSRRINCGSGGSSSCVFLKDSTICKQTRVLNTVRANFSYVIVGIVTTTVKFDVPICLDDRAIKRVLKAPLSGHNPGLYCPNYGLRAHSLSNKTTLTKYHNYFHTNV
jgi:hypothetical protein